jgi:rhodanese-related sulfurtransferase
MTAANLSPSQALARIERGAVLVDIREAGERRRVHIPGSLHRPLSQGVSLPDTVSETIFHCASGARTQSNAGMLAAAGAGQSFLLDGGINAWQKAGYQVHEEPSQPIDIMRQIMIVAGVLVLAGVILGSLVNPLFFGLSGFVGAGLVFSGVTGICAMAKILSWAPWNRPKVV